MTENIPQTGASERIEAARKALAAFNGAVWDDSNTNLNDLALEIADLAEATSNLITPPSVGESAEQIADRFVDEFEWPYSEIVPMHSTDLADLLIRAVNAGIQYAHERWEPAARPSQAQMLHWLGIRYTESALYGYVYIPLQMLDREES